MSVLDMNVGELLDRRRMLIGEVQGEPNACLLVSHAMDLAGAGVPLRWVEPNEAFIREVLAWIELHPEQWHQKGWTVTGEMHSPPVCQTTHCTAGWAYILGTGREWSARGGWRYNHERAAKAASLLGLDAFAAARIFYYTEQDGRHPTFAELCARVEESTKIKFKPETNLDG